MLLKQLGHTPDYNYAKCNRCEITHALRIGRPSAYANIHSTADMSRYISGFQLSISKASGVLHIQRVIARYAPKKP